MTMLLETEAPEAHTAARLTSATHAIAETEATKPYRDEGRGYEGRETTRGENARRANSKMVKRVEGCGVRNQGNNNHATIRIRPQIGRAHV